jgi:arylsulfatase
MVNGWGVFSSMGSYGRDYLWYADNLWLFVPIQQKIKAFFADFEQYPNQPGSSLNAAGINYQTLRAMEALKRLQQLEGMTPPR